MELLKMLSTNELVVAIVNFLLLLFILRFFLWKKVLGLLDERKKNIESEFKKAEDAQKEFARLQTEYQSKLDSIEEITRTKIQESIEEGKKIANEIRDKAQIDSKKILESAKSEITFEIAKAKEELKLKIIDLTIKATESILWDKITEENDKKLIEKYLQDVGEIKQKSL